MAKLLKTEVYGGLTVVGPIYNYLNKEDFYGDGKGVLLYNEDTYAYEISGNLVYTPSSEDETKDEFSGSWILTSNNNNVDITSGTTLQYESIIYNYEGADSNKWRGMLGGGGNSATADAILFTEDLIFNKPFGKYNNNYTDAGEYRDNQGNSLNVYDKDEESGLWESLSNKQRYKLHVTTKDKDGKPWTLNTLLKNAFCDYKSSVGSITQPGYTFSASNTASGELGTSLTAPSATFTVTSTGSYTYPSSATGVTYKAMIGYGTDITNSTIPSTNDTTATDNVVSKVSMGKNSTLTLTPGSFSGKFTDKQQTKTFYLKWEHSDGTIPTDSDGVAQSGSKITAKSGSTSDSVTFNAGWRRSWIGTTTNLSYINDTNIWKRTGYSNAPVIEREGNLSLSNFSEGLTKYGDLTAHATNTTILFFLTTNSVSPKFYYKDALGNRQNMALTKNSTSINIKDRNGNYETTYNLYYVSLTKGVTYKDWIIAK